MRKIFALAVCFVLLSTAVARAEMSVAVFDLQDVAAKSDVLKEAQAAVDKTFKPRKADLDKEAGILKTKTEAITKGTATDAQRSELLQLQQAYTAKVNEYMSDLQKADLRIRKDVDLVIIAAAKSYAQKKGFTLILDNQSAIYFDSSMDVTKDMLTEVNAQWRSMKK